MIYTALDTAGNSNSCSFQLTVLAPVFVTFQPPLAGQPVANKIRRGQVVPHKVRLTNCSGATVTSGVTVKLKVLGIDSGNNTIFQDVIEDANGVGSDGTVTSDGIMQLTDGQFHFNLDTSNFTDPNTVASARFYQSTVTVIDNTTGAVLGSTSVVLETKQ